MDEQKLAKLKARIGDEIFELLVGTRIDNVHMLDDTLLVDKLQEIVNAINAREKIVDVDKKIETAKTDVETKANTYTDQQITLVTETGIPKLMVYPLFCTASEEGQTVFNIELDTFDVNTDTVFVQSGRTMLAPELDFSIVDKTVVLVEGVPVGRTITIYVFKNVPIGEDGSVSGSVIADGSIPLSKLGEMPSAEDVGARPDTWTPTAADVGAVPYSKTNVDLNALLTSGAHFEVVSISISGYNTPYDKGISGAKAYTVFSYASSTLYGMQLALPSGASNTVVFMRTFNNGTIGEWSTGFLPLTGGTLSGDLSIENSSQPGVHLKRLTNNSRAYLMNEQSGLVNLGLQYVSTEGYTRSRNLLIWDDTAKPNLKDAFQFQQQIGNYWTKYNIFGEHNKPSGSYTGSNNATSRTVSIGGIGNALFIYGNNCYAIVTPNGAVCGDYGGNSGFLPKAECNFTNGVLTIATKSGFVNGNTTHYYQVL